MSKSRVQSEALYEQAKQVFPGGVNSPVRAFGSVGGSPLFIDKAKGAYVYDADGHEMIDYVGSWGPAILGHSHPEVLEEVRSVMEGGLSFGAPSRLENRLASKIQDLVPSMEMMRFVSSGTEACMSVLRLARAFTGRDKIIKFDGCYHGHADFLLVQAGSGVATLGLPGSPGVPKGSTSDTLVSRYNDISQAEELVKQYPDQVAAIILEPVVGNGGFIRPSQEFLDGLRALCDREGILLIFDEVMTGFRVNLRSAQGLFGIKPDLSTFGKVVGGGMPIGVYGGRRDIMAKLAPMGPVYQAGTLSGNPVAVSCGYKTLELLENKYSFTELSNRTKRLVTGLAEAANSCGVVFSSDSEGGMFGLSFSEKMPHSFDCAKKANIELFNKFFWGMLENGVYLAPSAFEAGFVSVKHEIADIDRTVEIAHKVFKGLNS